MLNKLTWTSVIVTAIVFGGYFAISPNYSCDACRDKRVAPEKAYKITCPECGSFYRPEGLDLKRKIRRAYYSAVDNLGF